MKYQYRKFVTEKKRFSPDFLFELDGFSLFYTYIRKNASTSFKKLFQELYPEACPGELPSIGCMVKHAGVGGFAPEYIDQKIDTKIFVFRDPVERVFSVFKNKLIQQDGADDLLGRLSSSVRKDFSSLTFVEFVDEYVALLQTSRWDEVDGHLYPQVWHLLPITYNKVIPMESVHAEMCKILPKDLCDRVFLNPVNSTRVGVKLLKNCGPGMTVAEFVGHYERECVLPAMNSVLTDETEQKLRAIYSDDYAMIAQVIAYSDSDEPQPEPLDSSLLELVAGQAEVVDSAMQFGISEVTLAVLRAFRQTGIGRLHCVVQHVDWSNTLLKRIDIEGLRSWLVLVEVPVIEWPYGSIGTSTPWFDETVLDALPPMDWVLVDKVEGEDSPLSRYPALPSVIDNLRPEAEVWMLGAEDVRVKEVVDHWCRDFSVSAEPIADGQILRVRV